VQATQSSAVKGEAGVSNSGMAARLHALDLVRASTIMLTSSGGVRFLILGGLTPYSTHHAGESEVADGERAAEAGAGGGGGGATAEHGGYGGHGGGEHTQLADAGTHSPPPHTHTHVAVALAPHTSAPAHLGLFDVRARMGRVATAGLNSTASFVSTETDRTSVSMPSQFIHPPQ